MPLKALRERLRLIRYYSATRPYNRWSRALDAAVLAALVAAWPVTWVLDEAVVARRTPYAFSGKLFEDPDGRVWAWLPPPAVPPDVRGEAAFHGAFDVSLSRQAHGWPFVTSEGRWRGRLHLEVFEEGLSLDAGDLSPDSPQRAAITKALVEDGYADAANVLWGGAADAAVTYRPLAWVANGIVWSIVLAFAAWVGVTVARAVALPLQVAHRARLERRRRDLRCAHCGYDLRASTFSDRCPECGATLA